MNQRYHEVEVESREIEFYGIESVYLSVNSVAKCSLLVEPKAEAKDKLTLRADGTHTLKWYVDAAFAVHPDFRSHTGGVLTMGDGAITSISRKQGINTRSRTEAEFVAADEVVGSMIWKRLFLEAQGYKITENTLYQDN